VKTGPNIGPAIGRFGARSASDPFAGVSRDAARGVYLPADTTEWDAFRSAGSLSIANPSNLWLMQEGSGNLADSIGAVALTASGTRSYLQSVSGWTRKAIGTTDGTAGAWQVASGVGPSPASTSVAALSLSLLPAPAAERNVFAMTLAASNLIVVNQTAAGLLKLYLKAGSATGAVSHADGNVHPLMIVYDRTNSTAKLYTDLEIVTAAYDTVLDGTKGWGGTPSAARHLYGAWWSGADAEMSQAQVRALFVAMGFSVAW